MTEYTVTTRDRNDGTYYTRTMWAYSKGEVYDRVAKFQPWNVIIDVKEV